MSEDVEETGEMDADALAQELDLGIELSPEEQAEANQMVARLRSQFGLDEETSEPPAEEEEDDEGSDTDVVPPVAAEESEEPPAPAPTAAPTHVTVDGREIPISEVQSMLQLRQWLEANPEKAQRLTEEPEPPAPEIPEWIDQDDPAQMAMWNRQVSLEAQVHKLTQGQQQIAETQQRNRAAQEVSAGFAAFRVNHPELSEEDIDKVRLHTVSMGLIDPLAAKMGAEAGTVKALDIAYKDIPEFQAREAVEAKRAKTADRKQKLSALGGTSGSAPRTETKPDLSSDRTAKAAAAEWLRQSGVLGPNGA